MCVCVMLMVVSVWGVWGVVCVMEIVCVLLLSPYSDILVLCVHIHHNLLHPSIYAHISDPREALLSAQHICIQIIWREYF